MHQFVNELTHGETVEDTYLLSEKHLRANRNGNLYLQAELRDRTGNISSRLWNATENLYSSIEAGGFVRIKGKVQLFQGSLQMILSQVKAIPSNDVELEDFLPVSSREVNQLEHRLKALLFDIADPQLHALMECFLIDEELMTRFSSAPAGIKNHHAYLGGLLEHAVNLLEVADRIVDLYPPVDRDLLLAGIFLHDIGKVSEFSYERSFQYSEEGQLVGHLIIGVELLNKKVLEAETLLDEPFDKELLLRLKHMILSHHGTYEFGSPKLPMTPEAIALHYLDNLDAKIHQFAQQIEEDMNPSSVWTNYIPSLGRKLYKGTQNPMSFQGLNPPPIEP